MIAPQRIYGPPFFPRGKGPVCSVLLPSRGRPEHLVEAVDSLISLASVPSNLEIIVKVDVDDNDTFTVVQKMAEASRGVTKIIHHVTPRGNGYNDIWRWLNAMAEISEGDWLLLFNDDATMQTQGWDIRLMSATVPCWHGCPEDVSMLIAETNGSLTSWEFVLLRRKAFEIMGHVCLSAFGDNWLMQVFSFIHSVFRTDGIKIKHEREDGLVYGMRGLKDDHWDGIGTAFSQPGIMQKLADVARLMAHVSLQDGRRIWKGAPDGPGWYCWRESAEHPMQFILLDAGGNYWHPETGCGYSPVPEDEALGGQWSKRG